MKGKWIYIIIGVLVLVLVFLLFKGKSGASKGYQELGTQTNIDEMMNSLQDATTQPPSAGDCRRDCRQICKPLDDKLFSCGDKCQCKEDCKSACAKGLAYKTMFP